MILRNQSRKENLIRSLWFIRVSASILSLVTLLGCVAQQVKKDLHSSETCASNPQLQEVRSKELQRLVKEDQDDRVGPIDWQKVSPRDKQRRMRVGEIFGEGCLKTASDFLAAALIYQHGTDSSHYFQTYIWAKQAVELGDYHQTRLMALGIDRYLVSINKKQLFGTQASQSSLNGCWCLEEIEESFDEKLRLEIAKQTLPEALFWVIGLNKGQEECEAVRFCTKSLQSTPKGSLPGIW